MRFVPNPVGIRELERSADVAKLMDEQAERAADAARSIAPVLTGAYRDSIHVEPGQEGGVPESQVTADVPYAIYVEFGTGDTPTFAPLRRGAQNAGLRLSG